MRLAHMFAVMAMLWLPLAWAAGDKAAQERAPATPSERKDRWDDVLKGNLPDVLPTTPPRGTGGGNRQLPPPQPPTVVEPDTATIEAYRSALREYYAYQQQGLRHRQRVFAWQHYSSIAIFVVVILLVGAGIYFAAVQFHHGLRGGARVAEGSTQLEAGPGGVKVSSPVLGVIILAISLAFFYLYLVFVYPIQEIF